MRKEISLSFSSFFLISVFLCFSSFDSCNARKSKHLKENRSPPSSPTEGHVGGSSTIFNVLDFNAKGDGTTDNTKAFLDAWANACKVAGSTVLVPSGSTFLVGPISFSGPNCQPNIIFQLDGTIIAPTGAGQWGSGLLQWLEFTKLKGITIRGGGVIDGRGNVWWARSELEDSQIYADSKMPSTKPTALRFYGSSDVTVTGITIRNSPQCHLKFDSCTGVQVSGVTVSSPGDSPHTDGIHLQNSQDVSILGSNIACGDDCVSIQTGCSNVNIRNVHCGPGHGISIGGLGKDDTKACVSGITVRDSVMHNTLNGVRIKTWQGGSGLVQDVLFSNIQVSEVESPIVIDQFYCDQGKCNNQSAAVALSNIHFEKITGTYTVNPVHLACSDALPCTGITLSAIQLQPLQEGRTMSSPYCWQTYGELLSPNSPPINCLRTGKPSISRGPSDGSC
ncbi:polygalacturonase At1g48100-like [Magnolia sinica]|uniref:polygalacturonase At1g48100-like n=1 Tax=Magnolia sinica TaxID=86752 RepID=UPI00265AB202|nr:polygalacturonase At1g48100-like [Magnolia sinica]